MITPAGGDRTAFAAMALPPAREMVAGAATFL